MTDKTKKEKIRFKHYMEYIFLVFLGFWLRMMPLWLRMPVFVIVTDILYIIDARHRNIMLSNIAHAFPDKLKKEQRRIARKSIRNLGRTFAEFLHLPRMNKRYVEKNIEISGMEYAEKAHEAGHGILGLTSHLDNWELLGTIMEKIGFDLRAIYHPMRNPLSDRYFNKIRTSTGMTLIPMKASPREFLRPLIDNAILGLIADQDAGKSGVFIDFLNRKASAWKGPVVFALKTKAALCFFRMERIKGRKHRLTVSPPIEMIRTGNLEEEIRINTQRWNDMLAQYIHEQPEQYYWVHRRWHTRPPEEQASS